MVLNSGEQSVRSVAPSAVRYDVFIKGLGNALAHGPQKYAGTANEKLNDDFAKATVVRLLRSNGASGYVMPIGLSVLMLRPTHCPNSGMHLFLDNFILNNFFPWFTACPMVANLFPDFFYLTF